NPGILEQIDSCRTLIFDKTGTLTYGKPTLTAVSCAIGFDRAEVMQLIGSLEQYSKHPLATAIVTAAKHESLALLPVAHVSEHPGAGLLGIVGGRKVEIVKRETAHDKTLFVGDGINDAPALLAATVGVAFGSASDITAEAADAVVLELALGKIDELMHIGRRMRRIALQSALGGMIA